MFENRPSPHSPLRAGSAETVVLRGTDLTINDVVQVARHGARVRLTDDQDILRRMDASHEYIVKVAQAGRAIYGVATGFGGMAHTIIAPEDAGELQENLLWFMKAEAGQRLPHAEQFNQNINSQGLGSANLARQSIEALHAYMAIALMVGVQAVDLRTYQVTGQYDARRCLSPATIPLYEAVRGIVAQPPSAARPFIRNDNEQSLAELIWRLSDDIAAEGCVPRTLAEVRTSLRF
ncbi:MAG: aromatic amino acid lyase [Desulfobacterales bacterium]|nr:MAG: aromatic amino acid lyase [Desulfobacterales bacterium]